MRPLLPALAASTLLLLAGGPLRAQEEQDEQDVLKFPDTLFFEPPAAVQHVATLDSLGTVVAELPDAHAKLVERTTDWYGNRYTLAVATADGFALHPFLDDDTVDEVRVATTDLHGDGRPEVVAHILHYAGHTGMEHSIHEREWTVVLWDVQAGRCLLRLPHGYSLEEWTNTYEEAPDSVGYDQRAIIDSEGSQSCAYYDVAFSREGFTLVPKEACPNDPEATEPDLPRPLRYRWSPGGWVKDR